MRDDAHAQQIAAAATTLRTARLSMQSSQMKYHLRSLSRSEFTSLLDAFYSADWYALIILSSGNDLLCHTCDIAHHSRTSSSTSREGKRQGAGQKAATAMISVPLPVPEGPESGQMPVKTKRRLLSEMLGVSGPAISHRKQHDRENPQVLSKDLSIHTLMAACLLLLLSTYTNST